MRSANWRGGILVTNGYRYLWKVAKWLIMRGYGDDCRNSGDFSEGCASCRAGKALDWIEGHIDLINS